MTKLLDIVIDKLPVVILSHRIRCAISSMYPV